MLLQGGKFSNSKSHQGWQNIKIPGVAKKYVRWHSHTAPPSSYGPDSLTVNVSIYLPLLFSKFSNGKYQNHKILQIYNNMNIHRIKGKGIFFIESSFRCNLNILKKFNSIKFAMYALIYCQGQRQVYVMMMSIINIIL